MKQTDHHNRTRGSRRGRAWRIFRPIAVFTISLSLAVCIVYGVVTYVLSNYIDPVDPEDATPIQVIIPNSSSAGTIARLLLTCRGEDEPGVISNTAVFKVYVDFVGKAGKLQAGNYILSRNMTIPQIVDIICEGNPPRETVKITIPEGLTVEDIAGIFTNAGFFDGDASKFLELNRTGKGLESFTFLPFNKTGLRYVTEGYLFPDTYEFYADASPSAVVTRMLNRFYEMYDEDCRTRAKALGMSMDQVMALASLIEREARVEEDFAKVSAVFHNRRNSGMKLESCASLSYVLGEKKYTFTEAETETDSLYNTYKYAGLPPGPICCPGKTALTAALNPNPEYLQGGYLFFCNGRLQYLDADGNVGHDDSLVFSKTYEEHRANVLEYRPYWP